MKVLASLVVALLTLTSCGNPSNEPLTDEQIAERVREDVPDLTLTPTDDIMDGLVSMCAYVGRGVTRDEVQVLAAWAMEEDMPEDYVVDFTDSAVTHYCPEHADMYQGGQDRRGSW